MNIIHVVSMSGGKDSTATAILAIEQHGIDACRFVFADTGNEHEATYEYALGYLPSALGIQVDVVRASFDDEFTTKRANLTRIAAGEPESAVYGKRKFKYDWTPAAAARALELLHPTGNPYLDMCMLKGGFPSRKRQFCTEYLKTGPLTEYALDIIDDGNAVWSWQGVRIDESESRRTRLQGTGACVKAFDVVGGGAIQLSANPSLERPRCVPGARNSRHQTKPALPAWHVQGRVHALHQLQQRRATRNFSPFPGAHCPHRRVGTLSIERMQAKVTCVVLPHGNERPPGPVIDHRAYRGMVKDKSRRQAILSPDRTRRADSLCVFLWAVRMKTYIRTERCSTCWAPAGQRHAYWCCR